MECQKVDYPTHKLLCREYANFDFTSRPSSDHKLCIVFPQDQRTPQLSWVSCSWKSFSDGRNFQSPDTTLPFDGGIPNTDVIEFNKALDCKLTENICFTRRTDAFMDGSKPNRSMSVIAAACGATFSDWRGPLLAAGMTGPLRDRCRDINLIDFRHIVDWLKVNVCTDERFHYYTQAGTPILDGTPSARANAREAQSYMTLEQKSTIGLTEPPNTKGIRLNCLGDAKTFGIPVLEEVLLNITHPIFNYDNVPDIPERIGIPLITMREPGSSAWRNATDLANFDNRSPFENKAASFLHLSCRDDACTGRSWGKPQSPWKEKAGSVLLVRKDKMPLEKLHVDILCQWIERTMKYLSATMGETPSLDKEEALLFVSKASFAAFWNNFLEPKKAKGDMEALKSYSPYDTKELMRVYRGLLYNKEFFGN